MKRVRVPPGAATVGLCIVALAIGCDRMTPVEPAPTAPFDLLPGAGPAGLLSYNAEIPNGSNFYRPVHMADMDGDARPEILIGNWSTDRIEIWRFDPALQKAVLSQQISGLPYDIHGIGSGDVDKDGDIDVLAAIRFFGVYLCRNNGGGSWTVSNLDPRYAWNTQVADFDRDGNLDVFGSLDHGSVLLYGDGLGNFGAGPTPYFIGSMGISVADFNGDGSADLMGPDGGFGRMMAYQNLGGRTWSANLGPGNTYPHQLVSELTPSALDLYGSGNLDQVALYHSANYYVPPMTVVIFEGSGAPGAPMWTPTILDVLPNRGLPVGAADLDDDGHLDVFVGGSFGFLGFRAYRGDGLGNFTAEDVGFTHGLGARNSFSVVDFNVDGASDIVAARHALGVDEPSQGFAILYRVPPPTFSCQGFEAPLDAGPVAVKKNRALPIKALVLDETGQPLGSDALTTPPAMNVTFVPWGGGSPVDVTADALPVGQGTNGIYFVYDDGKWQYNLKITNYTAAGAYRVSMLSGDIGEYRIQPTCEAIFVVM